MKWNRLTKLTLLLSCLGLQSLSAMALDSGRLFVWGLGGSRGIARADGLIPIISNQTNSLFYADIQGKIGSDNAYFGGAGLGYRGLSCSSIYGAYLFYDRDFSRNRLRDDIRDGIPGHHIGFSVINPGVEYMNARGWDLRANGYIPVGRHIKHGPSFFKTDTSAEDFTLDINDTCGENINTGSVVFSGHQEFVPSFHHFEEVGHGIDAEVGKHFCCGYDFGIYGGGYYYHLRERARTRDNSDNAIRGAEARAVLRIKPAVALTVEASYDNIQHGAVVGGIRVQLGHVPCQPCCLRDRLYDPIVRNIGTVKTGSGIPVVSGTKDEGLKLFRDNIWFFTGTGGGTFVSGAGTFEDPLANDQFTQTTVNGINILAPDANLFFNAGTYVINAGSAGAPNARISLPGGQSLFGRTEDYKASAVGAERPTLLGGLDLFAGNNTLDSIIVTNAMTTTGTGSTPITLNTLTIKDAPNIFICNSVINTILNITGDNDTILEVSALYATGSSVTIDTSAINAITTITGNDNLASMTTGIGASVTANNNGDAIGNTFAINNSSLNSQGIVLGNITNSEGNTGINYVSTIGGNEFSASANYENNVFILTDCILNSLGSVGQSMGGSAVNYVTNIGGNDDSQRGAGTAVFQNNQFTLNGCSLNSTASVAQNISFSGNAVTNIGGNALSDSTNPGSNFNLNIFNLNSCNLHSVASIGGEENGQNANFASVIGGNEIVGNSSFNQNVFNITSCSLNSVASVSELIGSGSPNINSATVIGGNCFGGNVSFNNNDFVITESSLSSIANVVNDNIDSSNFAAAIGGNAVAGGNANFEGNDFIVNSSSLSSTAFIGDDNSGLNQAIGIGGNATGAVADFIGNFFTVSNSTVDVLANVIADNTNTNLAIGWRAVSGTVNLLSDKFSITAIRGVGVPSIAIAKIPGAAIVNDSTTTYTVTQD